MNIENLVTMANQIGEYFSAYRDRREGEGEVANHLRKFWEPRMRRALLTYIDTQADTGLDEIVLNAIRDHRAELMPKDRAAA